MRGSVKVLLLICILITLFVNIPYVSNADETEDYLVSIECLNNEHYTEENTYTFYDITVTNNGNKDDTYNLTFDEPPDKWYAKLNVTTIFIPAGQSRNVTFKVKTGCLCEYGKSISLNVTAVSLSDENVTDSAQTITTYIHAGAALTSDKYFINTGLGTWRSIKLLVTNECAYNDTFFLSAIHSPDILSNLNQSTITLQGKGNCLINLTFRVSYFSSEDYYPIEIEAQSKHDPTKIGSFILTVFVKRPEFKIKKIYFSNEKPNEGDSVMIYVDILNNKSIDAHDFAVNISYLTEDGTLNPIGSENISLLAQQETTVQMEFSASPDISGFVIEIDSEGKYEAKEYSYTKDQLDFHVQEPESFPIIYLIILGLFIIVLIIIFIIYNKKKKKRMNS